MPFDFGVDVSLTPNYKKWKEEGNKVALIDGDLIPYIVCFTIDKEAGALAQLSVDNGEYSCISDTPQFIDAADHMNWIINLWVSESGCDSAKIYLTDSKSNFRINLAIQRPYKGQRPTDKPPFFYELREYLLQKHNAILSHGCEADDLISIEMTKDLERLKEEASVALGSPEHRAFAGCVCCTKDKDLRMIAGWHYNPDATTKDTKLFFVDELGWLEPVWKERMTKTKGMVQYIDKLKGAGLKFFYAQILMGDTADNYAGLERCGKTKAYELLDNCTTEKELYMTCLSAYEAKYKGKDKVKVHNYRGGYCELTPYQMMLEQGRLAYMQRKVGDVWRSKSYLPSGVEGGVWKS